jgi:hypothetical protein
MASAHHDSVSTPGERLQVVHDIGFDGVASDSFAGREQSLETQQSEEADDTAFLGVSCIDKTKVSRTQVQNQSLLLNYEVVLQV